MVWRQSFFLEEFKSELENRKNKNEKNMQKEVILILVRRQESRRVPFEFNLGASLLDLEIWIDFVRSDRVGITLDLSVKNIYQLS